MKNMNEKETATLLKGLLPELKSISDSELAESFSLIAEFCDNYVAEEVEKVPMISKREVTGDIGIGQQTKKVPEIMAIFADFMEAFYGEHKITSEKVIDRINSLG